MLAKSLFSNFEGDCRQIEFAIADRRRHRLIDQLDTLQGLDHIKRRRNLGLRDIYALKIVLELIGLGYLKKRSVTVLCTAFDDTKRTVRLRLIGLKGNFVPFCNSAVRRNLVGIPDTFEPMNYNHVFAIHNLVAVFRGGIAQSHQVSDFFGQAIGFGGIKSSLRPYASLFVK